MNYQKDTKNNLFYFKLSSLIDSFIASIATSTISLSGSAVVNFCISIFGYDRSLEKGFSDVTLENLINSYAIPAIKGNKNNLEEYKSNKEEVRFINISIGEALDMHEKFKIATKEILLLDKEKSTLNTN